MWWVGLRVTDSSGVKINPTWNRLKVEVGGGAEKMKSLQRLWSQAIEGEEREARTSVARGDRYLTEQDFIIATVIIRINRNQSIRLY